MTADRRLRFGGWAALATAVIAPIELVLVYVVASDALRRSSSIYGLLDATRLTCLLVAVIGLDALFRPIAPRGARLVVIAGSVGATTGIVVNAAGLAGVDAPVALAPGLLAASVLVGTWFIGGGALLMRAGGAFARIGWPAELGGLGLILAAILVALAVQGPGGTTGPSLLNWFQLLSLFGIVYLVRIWFYVVRGRLPGPGIV